MHTGVRGGSSCTPSKDFEKLDHKNAIKHENRGLPQIFSQPQVPPSEEFENDCASMPTKISQIKIWNLTNSFIEEISS